MKQRLRHSVSLLALISLGTGGASGYYYFTQYTTKSAPYTPLVEKFDLNALNNKTVPYFIAQPSQDLRFAAGDSYSALLGNMRAAAKVWNDVATSDLRLAYGGVIQADPGTSAASIQVVFGDVVPGLVATSSPAVLGSSNGAFVPIQSSVMVFSPDMSQRPSFGEDLFGTMVHEFGHALGLQHTLTSSAMSTSLTRATTRSKPLTADDVAGISLLYPAQNFQNSTGSISGRVTMNGKSVGLASVVALSPGGPAVSALTNPDGTYRIDGIPQRQYLVYVHPLPPPAQGEATPANVIWPVDPDKHAIAPSDNFETQFYPGVKDQRSAFPVTVSAGRVASGFNFSVRPISSQPIYAVETFASPGTYYVKPPYLNPAIPYPFVIAAGVGLMNGSTPTPGLTMEVVGGVPLNLHTYPYADGYVQADIDVGSFFGSDGPRHVLFTANKQIYVLPAAFYEVQNAPPAISSAASSFDTNGERSVVVTGTGFHSDTRILFDGLAGAVRSYDDLAQRMTVTPPFAPAGYKANLIAVNSDGQSSSFLQNQAVPTYTYDSADATPVLTAFQTATQFTLVPGSFAPGTEGMLEVDSQVPFFADGQTTVAFGTNDIAVRRVWVLSPTRLLANIGVSAGATLQPEFLNVTSGLQLVTQGGAFQVSQGDPRQLSLSSTVLNATTNQPGLQIGSTVVASLVSAIPPSASGISLFLNDKPTQILSSNLPQFTFQIPVGTSIGPNVIRVDSNGLRGVPLVIQVDPASSTIQSVNSTVAQTVDSAHAAHPGDTLFVQIAATPDLLAGLNPARFSVNIGGIDTPAMQASPTAATVEVFFQVPAAALLGAAVPVILSIDGRPSAPYLISIRNAGS